MRIIETKAYKLEELDADARAKAFRKYQDAAAGWELPWQDETMDSLKAVCAAAGVKIKDYNLGAYNRGNMLRVEIPGDDAAAELTGARAFAWLENRLFGRLRARWGLPKIPPTREVPKGFWRHEDGHYTRYTKPGAVPDCPFTGYCADDDFLDDLKKSVRDGRTIKEAFEDLADVFARMMENECEYQQSEEAFETWADGMEFDADGDTI